MKENIMSSLLKFNMMKNTLKNNTLYPITMHWRSCRGGTGVGSCPPPRQSQKMVEKHEICAVAVTMSQNLMDFGNLPPPHDRPPPTPLLQYVWKGPSPWTWASFIQTIFKGAENNILISDFSLSFIHMIGHVVRNNFPCLTQFGQNSGLGPLF